MESRCWKTIGVWGSEKPRCPKLEEVIHCRNCDQFTQAGRNLLERELPEEYQSEWGQIFAVKKIDAPVGTVALVIFRIEEESIVGAVLPNLTNLFENTNQSHQ